MWQIHSIINSISILSNIYFSLYISLSIYRDESRLIGQIVQWTIKCDGWSFWSRRRSHIRFYNVRRIMCFSCFLYGNKNYRDNNYSYKLIEYIINFLYNIIINCNVTVIIDCIFIVIKLTKTKFPTNHKFFH